jgi:hypothetical protein
LATSKITINVLPNQKESDSNAKVFLPTVRIENSDNFQISDDLGMSMQIRNRGITDMKNTKINVFIPDLGLQRSTGPFTVNSGDQVGRNINLDFDDARHLLNSGDIYWVRVSVKDNEGLRRVRYRPIMIE